MRLMIALAASLVLLGAAAADTGKQRAENYAGAITAVGTEPFWKLVIGPEDGIYFSPMEGEAPPAAPYATPAIGTDGTATFATKDFTVVLKATGACSDGMSDLVFPIAAKVTVGKQTYQGCAYRRWDNDLLAFLPQIDACLARAKSKGPVSIAAQTVAGVIVRVPGGEAGTYECLFPEGMTEPSRAGIVADPAAIVGEWDPSFYRAPGEDPGGECFAAPEVKAADGTLIGWILPNEPC